jgi:predicted dehydrogenase
MVTVVGLGPMGRRHARVLCALRDRFELVGAYDLRPDAQPPRGVALLTSIEEAVALADVVVVATPMESHARVVASALSVGKHVLVEKPLCSASAEAHALVAAARAGGRLFVAHSERFNPVIRALSRLVPARDLMAMDMRRVGLFRPAAGGALLNLGIHDLDLAAYLGGGEAKIASALGAAGGADGEDFAHVLFSTATGAVGHLYVDRTRPVSERAIVLTTADWVYEGDLLAHRLFRSARGGTARADVPVALEEPLVAQANALADALDGRGGRELATGIDGARAVALAEQGVAFLVTESPLVRSSAHGAGE